MREVDLSRLAKRPLAEHVDTIIENLYQGTIEDAAWSRAMIGIANITRASSALLFAYKPNTVNSCATKTIASTRKPWTTIEGTGAFTTAGFFPC